MSAWSGPIAPAATLGFSLHVFGLLLELRQLARKPSALRGLGGSCGAGALAFAALAALAFARHRRLRIHDHDASLLGFFLLLDVLADALALPNADTGAGEDVQI